MPDPTPTEAAYEAALSVLRRRADITSDPDCRWLLDDPLVRELVAAVVQATRAQVAAEIREAVGWRSSVHTDPGSLRRRRGCETQ